MEPIAAAAMMSILSTLALALLLGSLGGVITAALKGDLALGAIATEGLYLVASPPLVPLVAPVGSLPLVVTFLVGSLTTRWLRTRFGLHLALAALAGLVAAIGAGMLYALPIRFDSWAPVDEMTFWIALGIILGLVVLSIRRRRRARQAAA